MEFLIALAGIAVLITLPSLLAALVVSSIVAWGVSDPFAAAVLSGVAGVLTFWAGLLATFAFVINLDGTYVYGLLILLIALSMALMAIPFFLAFSFFVWVARRRDLLN